MLTRLIITILIKWVSAVFKNKINKKPTPHTIATERNTPTPSKNDIRTIYSQKSLMTGIEQELFSRLKMAIGETCDIHGQVALNQLVDVPDQIHYKTAWNQIAQKSVDFVVTHTTSDGYQIIVAAIELDDKTHLRADRMRNDAVKNEVLKTAGITLIRWQVSKMPTVSEIRKLFLGEQPKPPVR